MLLKPILTFVSKLSKRERSIFYLTSVIVGVVLLDRLVMSPILSKIYELNEIINAQEDSIEQSLIIVMQETRIEGESKQYIPYLSEPQGEEKEVTAFLKEVENIAKKSSAYLVDIKPTGKDVEGVSTKYFVKLNFEAQMEQVFIFFYNITNYTKLLKIESYDITPKTEGTSVVTCSVSVSKAIISE